MYRSLDPLRRTWHIRPVSKNSLINETLIILEGSDGRQLISILRIDDLSDVFELHGLQNLLILFLSPIILLINIIHELIHIAISI